MKFRQKIILHLLIYVVIGTSLSTLNNWSAVDTGDIVDVPDPVVHIPDPMLAQALRKEMKLHPNLKITKARIVRLGMLNISNQGIKDLTGLEHALRLTRLIIAFNPVSDLKPLADLRGLRHLDARECNISDLTPLANLRYLVELRLSGNQIEDITPVENLLRLRRLEILEIDDNPLADSSILKQFEPVDIPDHNLRAAISGALNLPDGFPITQSDMRKLTALDAPESQITYLTGLEYATNLIFLGLGGNNISDLTPLGELARLEILYLSGNPLSDLSPLTNLTALQHLALQRCQISDITLLASLTQLSQLKLSGNQIVDVRPLANLATLRELEIIDNLIIDHSPLDTLALTHFHYDQTCEMPPLSLRPRLENRTFPSVFAAWGGIGWSPVLNQPHLSDLEQMSQHDLYFCCLIFNQGFIDTGDGWEVRGPLDRAIQIRNDYIALNPNMIFLVGLEFSGALLEAYPDDWPYWLRDAQGKIVKPPGEGPPAGLFDFTNPGFQDRMVAQAVAVSKCGLYDGIMIDWWNDNAPRLAIGNTVYRGLEVEIQAKINIMQRIRVETRPDFLIIGNINRNKLPHTGKYLNGGFMETGTPFHDRNIGGPEEIERGLREVESTLLWAEGNMREPQINSLEGWGFPNEPMDSLTNLRWMRVFTTLSLTHSDGYTLFIDPTRRSHGHYWYDFWDADLGRPVGPKAQLYDEDIPRFYIREYTNGWAVYNRSGEVQAIALPEEAQGVASGLVNTEHALPNLDGEIYLRIKPKNPADVNEDGVVNIFDLTIVAQGFGTESLEGDVNGDGVVNVFDLVFVANQF